MKPLATEFKQGGFGLKQVRRVGDVAIFEKRKGTYLGWEVVRVRRHGGYTIAGNAIQPAEVYPNSEAWGVSGFTCQTMEAANRRFDLMLK